MSVKPLKARPWQVVDCAACGTTAIYVPGQAITARPVATTQW